MNKKLISLITFVLSALAFYLWFKDWVLVAVVMASVVLHEAGHALALHYYGKSSYMVFVPFLGAAVVPNDNNLSNFNFFQHTVTYLAGPFANLILLCISATYLLIDPGNIYATGSLAINVSLMYFNLLPFGFLDGGQIVKYIFESTDEARDKIIATAILAIALIGSLVLLIFGKLNLSFAIIAFGAFRASKKDDPGNAHSRKAMKMDKVIPILVIYCLMLFGGLVAEIFTPNWVDLFNVWPANKLSLQTGAYVAILIVLGLSMFFRPTSKTN